MNPELKEFIKKSFKEPGKALDLGCGDKTDMFGLEKMGWKCDGVDIIYGTDLNQVYVSENKPYDFVYSNYVIQKLENDKALVETIQKNLSKGGSFFIHTFDIEDEFAKKKYAKDELIQLFVDSGLMVDSCEKMKVWDDEPGHNHYHYILQLTGKNT